MLTSTSCPKLPSLPMTLFLLDARTATFHFPGIGRYVASLVPALTTQLEAGESLLLAVGSEGLPPALAASQAPAVPVRASPFSLAQQWQLPRLLRHLTAEEGPLLYHSAYYLMPYRPGVPTVLTFYDLIPLLYPESVSRRARLLFQLTTRLALHAADHVLAISEASRRDLLTRFKVAPERVTTAPLAAAARFSPQPAAALDAVRAKYDLRTPFLLYVGINKPHKNLVTLVEAFVRARRGAWRLVIAGAWDPRYPQARTAAAELAPGDAVRFLGPIDEDDLPALYAAAEAFVFPSRYEGFGLPVLEAMACGAAVACSNVSSLPEIAGEAALLFPPEDQEAMAQTLARLMDDAALRTRLREKSLVRAA
ncbi:MAG: glycosyltransferase family 4 protein, partial [Caldilineaceae bacterium]|nr:glycosyltransferase family 4 protein [Caldilineaceae bacterium]